MRRLFYFSALFLVLAILGLTFLTNIDILNRRGCCSSHGGVCGCSGGSAQCCDGTLSPTCGCD